MVEDAPPPEEGAQLPATEPPDEVKLPMVIRFGIDVVVGTFAFALLAGAAAALSVFVAFLARHGVSAYVLLGLKAAEMLIFAADILLFTAFILLQAFKLGREMWRELRE